MDSEEIIKLEMEIPKHKLGKNDLSMLQIVGKACAQNNYTALVFSLKKSNINSSIKKVSKILEESEVAHSITENKITITETNSEIHFKGMN